jgi:hypothetical protein
MACAFLGLLGTHTVEVGRLGDVAAKLGDEEAAVKGFLEQAVGQQALAAMPPPTPTVLTVGEVAQIALGEATNLKFDSEEIFRDWWKDNTDYEAHLWYWANRWMRYNCADDDLPRLFERDPKAALSILVLATSDECVRNEAHRETASYVYFSDPSPARVAAQVAKYKVRQQVVEMVTGRFPANYAVPGHLRARLASTRALPILDAASTPADAEEIKGLLERSPGVIASNSGMKISLAQLAAKLDPAHAADILREQVKKNPGFLWLAAELVKLTGEQDWATVKTSYLVHNNEGGAATLFEAIVAIKTGDARGRLAELLEADLLEVLLTESGLPAMGETENQERFLAFVKAAQTLNGGKAVVDEATVQKALVAHPMKMTNDQLAALAERNRAAVAVRREAVATLLKFFQGAGR